MKTGHTTHGALLCSLVQDARVVLVHVIRVGVRCVTVAHIGHDEVLVVIQFCVAIFVVIFCIWRCTLYTSCTAPLFMRPTAVSCDCALCLTHVSCDCTADCTCERPYVSEFCVSRTSLTECCALYN